MGVSQCTHDLPFGRALTIKFCSFTVQTKLPGKMAWGLWLPPRAKGGFVTGEVYESGMIFLEELEAETFPGREGS